MSIGRRGDCGRRRPTLCTAAQARILPHSIAWYGGVYASPSKADRRANLEREQSVVCRDCPSCDCHPTVVRVLGATLRGNEVVEVGQSAQGGLDELDEVRMGWEEGVLPEHRERFRAMVLMGNTQEHEWLPSP